MAKVVQNNHFFGPFPHPNIFVFYKLYTFQKAAWNRPETADVGEDYATVESDHHAQCIHQVDIRSVLLLGH